MERQKTSGQEPQRGNQIPNPLRKVVNQVVDEDMWCLACDMPHSPYQCAVAMKLQGREEECEEYADDHAINLLSFEDYDSSEGSEGSDVNSRQINQ